MLSADCIVQSGELFPEEKGLEVEQRKICAWEESRHYGDPLQFQRLEMEALLRIRSAYDFMRRARLR